MHVFHGYSVVALVVSIAVAHGDCGASCEKDEHSLLQRSPTVAQLLVKPTQQQELPVADDSKEHEAEKLMGVTRNTAGDLFALFNNILTNLAIAAGCSVAFSVLRQRFPRVYSDNVAKQIAPVVPDDSFLGWVKVGFTVDIDQAAETLGLDSALMLEFINLSLKILAIIMIPSILMLMPMHMLFGQNDHGVDRLSKVGMANVKRGHPWLYYVHGLVVLGVCIVLKSCVFHAQSTFLNRRRFKWLKGLHGVRARTVLVEGIPEDWRSAEGIRKFFTAAFDANLIEDVHMVMKTEALEHHVSGRDKAKNEKLKAERYFQEHGERPTYRPNVVGSSVDAIDHWTKQVEVLTSQISEERSNLQKSADTVGGVNCASAFVTFKDKKHAEIAKELDYFPDPDEFVVSMAPDSRTIRWWNLRQSAEYSQAQQLLGYAAIFGLYVAFMPACLGTTNIANAINLGPTFAAMAPSLGLTLWLSFFPTVLLFIIENFFCMSSSHLAQERLLVWYFWFQVVFVILVTAIGNDFVNFIAKVAMNPIGLATIMADQLPKATHFYINYLVLQWSTHFMNLLRYINLSKFLGFKQIYGEEEAKSMSEPEAQDYYGFGSRSARWTIKLIIGIIFSTLSPTVPLMAFIDFVFSKCVYGYLITVAETKKADMGGHFWVDNLRHTLMGGILYSVLMAGVLFSRAPNKIPGFVATGAVFFMFLSLHNFDRAFQWVRLPYHDVMFNSDGGLSVTDDKSTGEGAQKRSDEEESYQQPELLEEKKEAAAS
eukprot:TRINITY_DN7654_c0_g3_i1.p1 TRINITY_DN7654_c0_g3~~TRINITY_DN7654_c0_g3_i1.p1  ORF type:complete len:766 (-),score=140.34 TRINITY_DN7654_c0_g3_i1:182-2479(-)